MRENSLKYLSLHDVISSFVKVFSRFPSLLFQVPIISSHRQQAAAGGRTSTFFFFLAIKRIWNLTKCFSLLNWNSSVYILSAFGSWNLISSIIFYWFHILSMGISLSRLEYRIALMMVFCGIWQNSLVFLKEWDWETCFDFAASKQLEN